MSWGVLCNAVVSRLQSQLKCDRDIVALGFDGEPDPVCGELFIRVHPGYWRAITSEGLAEEYGVNVTVTRRLGVAPPDRLGEAVWMGTVNADESLEATVRRVVIALHKDVAGDAIINAANAILGDDVNGFVEPLELQDPGQPMLKGADWFHAEGAADPPCGVAWTIGFGGATRYQNIENMA